MTSLTLMEFYYAMERMPEGDYIVTLIYQQNEHYKPEQITTIYYNYRDDCGWLDDWDEGGTAKIIGFVSLHHVEVKGAIITTKGNGVENGEET